MNDSFKVAVVASVKAAIVEDLGPADVSARLVPETAWALARTITREAGVFCGRPWVDETCRQIDPRIKGRWLVADGDPIAPQQTILELEGPARSLLTAERTLLNFAQLLSGVATRTRRCLDLIEGTGTKLLDTRKTIPGLRIAQKYAVRCGGGLNHRMGLFDAYLIKENHIAAAGSIIAAVRKARALNPDLPVEVEVESLQELDTALKARPDRILLDNFSIDQCAAAVAHTANQTELEASGGIEETTLAQFAQTGVDYISLGTLTKSIQPLDLSMRFLQTTP